MAEWTLKRVLTVALSMEEASIELYTSAQTTAEIPASKEFLKELVTEEKKHRATILEMMQDPTKIPELGSSETEIEDLKIVDWLQDVPLSSTADYQQILIYAGKREKLAHDLYLELARRYPRKLVGQTFKRLAQEELKHKHRLELEYDDIILQWM